MSIKGEVAWQSPSNIALVKYWGKYGRQLPRNPSISFTLNNAHTQTSIRYIYSDKQSDDLDFTFLFEGEKKSAFEDKIRKYLSSIKDEYPIVGNLQMEINSFNSFPHSSGIASSASSMSAFALCLLDIEKECKGSSGLDYQKASHFARLGSGSASRSVYGPLAIWGETAASRNSSNLFAVPYEGELHNIYHNYHDDILIVSKEEKAVSSRAGHALMEGNPYALPRYEQAKDHLIAITEALKSGDLDKFILVVEKEALTLHALMMASEPPYMLMLPNTVAAIGDIQAFRRESNIPVCFTLDAGPNIHLLYPDKYKSEVAVLKASLVKYCDDGRIIEDVTSQGPIKLK